MKYYQYIVEGDNEYILITYLKEKGLIPKGKVIKFNVVEKRLKESMLRSMKNEINIILIFDTDTGKTDNLADNIRFLKTKKNQVKSLITLAQVKNLEDELVRCSNMNHIFEMFQSSNKKEHKHKMNHCKNLDSVFSKINLQVEKLWTKTDEGYEKLTFGRDKLREDK